VLDITKDSLVEQLLEKTDEQLLNQIHQEMTIKTEEGEEGWLKSG